MGNSDTVVETPAAPDTTVAEVKVTEVTEGIEAPKVAEETQEPPKAPEVAVTETQEPPKEPVTETQEPPKVTLEVNAHELEEIRAILAERQKDYQVR